MSSDSINEQNIDITVENNFLSTNSEIQNVEINEKVSDRINMKINHSVGNVLSNSESVRTKKPKIPQKIRELSLLPFPVRTPKEWADEFKIALGMSVLDPHQNIIYDSNKLQSCISLNNSINKYELNSLSLENNRVKEIKERIDSDIIAERERDKEKEKQLVGLEPDPGSDSVNSIMVNEQFSVRLPDDLYGRRLTEIRRLYTDDDITPLDTE